MRNEPAGMWYIVGTGEKPTLPPPHVGDIKGERVAQASYLRPLCRARAAPARKLIFRQAQRLTIWWQEKVYKKKFAKKFKIPCQMVQKILWKTKRIIFQMVQKICRKKRIKKLWTLPKHKNCVDSSSIISFAQFHFSSMLSFSLLEKCGGVDFIGRREPNISGSRFAVNILHCFNKEYTFTVLKTFYFWFILVPG